MLGLIMLLHFGTFQIAALMWQSLSHADWPKGTAFVVGHALLTLLFSSLAASYLGLFVWHVWLSTTG
jgi:hypothetical protein